MADYFKRNLKYNTYYTAVGKRDESMGKPFEGEGDYYAPKAFISIDKPREVEIRDADDLRAMMYREEHPDTIEAAVEEYEQRPQMFLNQKAHITEAFADPRMRHTVPTLLGMALNEYKGPVRPSNSISEHSAKLAEKGEAAGLIESHPENPFNDPSNDISEGKKPSEWGEVYATVHDSGEIFSQYGTDRRVSDSEVAAAKRFARNALRPKPLSGQFEALQKFEASRGATYNPDEDPNAQRLF